MMIHTTTNGGAAMRTEKRLAYVPVMREKNWHLAIAVEGEKGYNDLGPGWGPYENRDAAADHADELNGQLGLTVTDAAKIICSTF
jgi:hypothetical protein